MADPTEIYQVVMNLCTNAAHAMADNPGVLTIGLGNLALDKEQKAHGMTVPPGNYVGLTIRDTGSRDIPGDYGTNL